MIYTDDHGKLVFVNHMLNLKILLQRFFCPPEIIYLLRVKRFQS